MDEQRAALDALVKQARKNVRKFESLTALEKREFQVEMWEAIAAELNAAYLEQMAGVNYRLTIEDVRFAKRVAVWFRYELDLQTWKADEENAAALNLRARVSKLTGAQAVLPDEVNRRLALMPQAPDTKDPPYLPARMENRPQDWPDACGQWSVWLEGLIRLRRSVAALPEREPGDDEDTDAA